MVPGERHKLTFVSIPRTVDALLNRSTHVEGAVTLVTIREPPGPGVQHRDQETP